MNVSVAQRKMNVIEKDSFGTSVSLFHGSTEECLEVKVTTCFRYKVLRFVPLNIFRYLNQHFFLSVRRYVITQAEISNMLIGRMVVRSSANDYVG